MTLKVRFADFRTVTRQDTAADLTADGSAIFRRAWEAFERLDRPQAIRLIGLSVSGLEPAGGPRQLPLFGDAGRRERLQQLRDEVRARFGPRALTRASLGHPEP